jgi:hypothetical protein
MSLEWPIPGPETAQDASDERGVSGWPPCSFCGAESVITGRTFVERGARDGRWYEYTDRAWCRACWKVHCGHFD